MEETMTGAGIFGILLFIIAIVWLILPFAVFGIKPLLREILDELRILNGKPRKGMKGIGDAFIKGYKGD